MMRDAAKSKLFGILMDFAQRCVELLAAKNGRQPCHPISSTKVMDGPDSVAEILAKSRSVKEDAVASSDKAKGRCCGDDQSALRGNSFFELVKRQVINEADCRLPELFVEFVRICKLVQYLDALLCTGYLKHKKEPLKQLHVLGGIRIKQLDFCCEWCGEQVTEPYPRARARKGLLLYALLNSATFARPNDRMYSVCL